ncbi:M35 family metallo-endopeptidase [Variovorax sp. E3]|uniref:M35 family metallo-endopeptidase n=1 Tax=Variovorax sp. E3 TaxID=1914993 RepID=UPI0018DE33C6|nr:M35 family metallo-endopeptidase [Variovorax sp. E3]
MERKILVVGDPPAPGGAVLSYDGPLLDLYGHRVALVGGRAYCEGCNSVGIIAKTGGPRRPRFISEAALEGDMVVCQCPAPQPILSTLQQWATCDDGAWHSEGNGSSPAAMAMLSAAATGDELAAFKKTLDKNVAHPPGAEMVEGICPNMTNKEFCAMMLRLRDQAVVLIAKKRLPELERWDKDAQARVKEWFGTAAPSVREHLQKGLVACRRVLEELECGNFIRYSEANKRNLGCVFSSDPVVTVAAVCKPDTATRTIAIGLSFCDLPENMRIYDTDVIRDGDSKLLTLIHEVTHFDDIFGSFDTWYGTKHARDHAEDPRSRVNADSIAAYILGVVAKASR